MTAKSLLNETRDSYEGLPEPEAPVPKPASPVRRLNPYKLQQELKRRGYVYDDRLYWKGFIKQVKAPVPIKGQTVNASGVWLRLNHDDKGHVRTEVGVLTKNDRRTSIVFSSKHSSLVYSIWTAPSKVIPLLDALDEFLAVVQKGQTSDTRAVRELFIRLTAPVRTGRLATLESAQDIVKRLLDEQLDSLEGVPDYDAWRQKAFDPKTPEHREWRLLHQKPRSPREAAALGVNWYIKDGRKYTFSMAEPDYGGYPRKSHTLATNRNLRRKSFGYRDVYSTRERDWPSGGRNAFYRRKDREHEARQQAAQAEVDRLIGSGI